MIGGVPAAETGAFQTGTFIEFNLTADGEPVAPPAPPAPEPENLPAP